jgi:DNA-binding transcriptional LysR family regulator
MQAATPDLRQLRYFIAVAEEKHFGRAAVRLSMTQPPLSQAIRALEETLGVELFARTKRSVELTQVGADLLPEVRRLLASAEGLRPLAQGLARGEAGVLSLAFVSTADYGLLPQLLRDFGAYHPRVRLQLAEATSDVQIDELVAGRVDAGLVIAPLPPRHLARLSWLPIAREPLVIAMSSEVASRVDGHPDEDWRDEPVTLRDVAEAPLVIFPRRLAPGFYDIIMDCYGVAGLTPRIGQEAIQMQTIVSLVSAGMGVALVPQSLRNLRRTGVVYRPLRESVPAIETGLVWRTGEVSPVLAGFIDIVRAYVANLAASMTSEPAKPKTKPKATSASPVNPVPSRARRR